MVGFIFFGGGLLHLKLEDKLKIFHMGWNHQVDNH